MAEDKKKELTLKFQRMAEQFGWDIANSTKSIHSSNGNTNHLNESRSSKHSDESNQNNSIITEQPSFDMNTQQCPTCGATVSSFLIDNHKRHCIKHHADEIDDTKEDHEALPPSVSPSPTSSSAPTPQKVSNELIACKYCEYGCSEQSITDHELYCASRTDLCDICGARDTIKRLTENTHQCNITNIQTQNQFVDLCSSDDDEFEDMYHRNPSSHNYNNANRVNITPPLVRQERERIKAQQEMDHEFAMNLQREMQQQSPPPPPQQPQPSLQAQQQTYNDYYRTFADVDRSLLRTENPSEFNSAVWRSGAQQIHFHHHNNHNNNNNNDHFGLEQLNMSNIDNLSYEDLNNLFPNLAQGAKEETIHRLPTETFHTNDATNSDKNKCCICLEQFKNGEEVRRLQCLHIFHTEEIDQWLRQNKMCPICRIDVEEHI